MPGLLVFVMSALAADLPEAKLRAARNATARVVVLDQDRRGTGSAFAVGQREGWAYFLTAAHVVRDSVRLELETFTDESYPQPGQASRRVELVARDDEADVAVIRVPADESVAVPLRLAGHRAIPRRFEGPFPVWSVGCPDGLAPVPERDELIRKVLVEKPRDSSRFFWQTGKATTPGRSGGPLIGSDGAVLGICSAAQDGRGYYSHGDEILAVLKRQGCDWIVKGATDR